MTGAGEVAPHFAAVGAGLGDDTLALGVSVAVGHAEILPRSLARAAAHGAVDNGRRLP